MKQLELDVFGTEELETVVTDLLVSNEGFYNLTVELLDSTGNDAGCLDFKELEAFSSYLDKYTKYYPAELLYMVHFAMNDVYED